MSSRPIPIFQEAHPEHPRFQEKVKPKPFISYPLPHHSHRHSMVEDDLLKSHINSMEDGTESHLPDQLGRQMQVDEASTETNPNASMQPRIESRTHSSYNRSHLSKTRRPNTSLGVSQNAFAKSDQRRTETGDGEFLVSKCVQLLSYLRRS